jgi:hypothetical protein
VTGLQIPIDLGEICRACPYPPRPTLARLLARRPDGIFTRRANPCHPGRDQRALPSVSLSSKANLGSVTRPSTRRSSVSLSSKANLGSVTRPSTRRNLYPARKSVPSRPTNLRQRCDQGPAQGAWRSGSLLGGSRQNRLSCLQQADGDGQTYQCGSAPGIRRTYLVPSRTSKSGCFALNISTRQPDAGF